MKKPFKRKKYPVTMKHCPHCGGELPEMELGEHSYVDIKCPKCKETICLYSNEQGVKTVFRQSPIASN